MHKKADNYPISLDRQNVSVNKSQQYVVDELDGKSIFLVFYINQRLHK